VDGAFVGLAPFVAISGITKRFGDHVALADCSLAIGRGEIVTLLGPSGCGKTTLLRCIAGFAEPDAGAIAIDDVDTLALPVNRRPVGVVFQNYALFPHLTVAANVGYGLKMRGVAKAEIDRRVGDILALVSMSELKDRFPIALSGGQQQRVAVARALVLEPKVLLLDEAFNALDAKLRAGMQAELRKLIKRLGMTAIFVTHDQEEALAISDRVAVMGAGRIAQVASPIDIYDRPATPYVAQFVGTSNMLAARAAANVVTLPGGVTLDTPLHGDVQVLVRPQNFEILTTGDSRAGWQGRVAFGRPAGAIVEYEVDVPDAGTFKIAALRDSPAGHLAVGTPVGLAVRDASSCIVFEGAP
jgi:ABC-type Fe3+/spermidine/putrescine transport system ATPase subunit